MAITRDFEVRQQPTRSEAVQTSSTSTSTSTRTSTPRRSSSSGTTSQAAAPTTAAAAPAAAPAPAPSLSILSGQNMQWFRDPAGNYYVAYGLPNSSRYAFFEAMPQQMDALFGVGNRPTTTMVNSLQDIASRPNYTFSGNIGEVAGTGTFENAVNRSVALAMDNGQVPSWMQNSPEVWDVLYLAEAEGKSNDWVLGQIRNTQAFQQRFVGIDTLEKMGMTLGDAVTGYMEYEQQLKQLSNRYPNNGIDAVTPQVVGDLLKRGQSIEDVQFTFQIFDRMEQNQASFENFNEILSSRGLNQLGPADQFQFLAGNAPKELYDIWEQTSVLTAAEQAGIKDFDLNKALQVAQNTPGLTSEQQAFEGMTEAAKLLLQFRREVNLGRLDQDDLIDLSLGSAPRSGRSQAELAQEMSRIVREAESYVQNKVRPVFSYTETGRPKAASLGELSRNQSVD